MRHRTPWINPLFHHNLHKFKGLDVLEIVGEGRDSPRNYKSTRSDTIIELLQTFRLLTKAR